MCDSHGKGDMCACGATSSSSDEHGRDHLNHEHSAHERSGHDHTDHDHGPSAGTVSAEYGVEGMTCSHCVASVTEEISRLDGVRNVDVDLVAGGTSRVTVSSSHVLDDDEVAAAVNEAGYELAALPR
jgi:copper chaperone